MKKAMLVLWLVMVSILTSQAQFQVSFYWDASVTDARLWVNDGGGWQQSHFTDNGLVSVGVVTVECPVTTWGGWEIFLSTQEGMTGYFSPYGTATGAPLLHFAGDGTWSSWEYFPNSNSSSPYYYGEFMGNEWVPLNSPYEWQAGDPMLISQAASKKQHGKGHAK